MHMRLQYFFLFRLVQDALMVAQGLYLIDAVVSCALDGFIDQNVFFVELIREQQLE